MDFWPKEDLEENIELGRGILRTMISLIRNKTCQISSVVNKDHEVSRWVFKMRSWLRTVWLFG